MQRFDVIPGFFVDPYYLPYQWKRRVLPMPASDATEPGGIDRVSLVLGLQEVALLDARR
jgi:hypothetical protein